MSSSAVATIRPSDPPTMPDLDRPTALAPPPLFAADLPDADHAGHAPSANLLADLAAHPAAETPFLIAVHGSSGSGKSSLLRQIVRRLRDPSPGAGARARTLAVMLDASQGGDTGGSLVSGIFAGLKAHYPDFAEEARHAGGDPLKIARAAGDRVSALRRQLDAERQVLDELGARQARLVETVLFDSPGSRIDSYARTHRSRIEGRLRAFGLPTADPIATYKELVREAAESESGGSRSGTAIRALWAFKGQGTLIVLAILMLIVGWGSTDLAENQDLWVAWLNGLGERFAGVSAWAQDHANWLVSVSHGAYALAALVILIDILRAFRFIQPVVRGASLLHGDLDGRRRDIDSLVAHQTRRVDHLATEVEEAVRVAEAAERRLENRRAAGLLEPASMSADADFGVPPSPHASAEAFLAGLGAVIGGAGRGFPGEASSGPNRVVVVLDELDRLAPQAAAAYLDTAQKLLARPGFVALVAVDRQHVLDGFSDTDPAYAAARLGRCVQISFDLDAETLAALSLGETRESGSLQGTALDKPWREHESQLIRDLSPFAGRGPRAIKRFANTYRVARADPRMMGATPAEEAGLALALALDESAVAAELNAYASEDIRADPGAARSDLDDGIAAAQAAIGEAFTPSEARRGLQVARIYSRRG